MEREQGNCNRALAQKDTLGLVNGTSALARQANHVLMITNAERDNSEDPLFTNKLHKLGLHIQQGWFPMRIF